jgi:hypothetical protein
MAGSSVAAGSVGAVVDVVVLVVVVVVVGGKVTFTTNWRASAWEPKAR